MTKYNTLDVKLCNSLKSGIKNGNEVTLKLSLNEIGSFNDETNFLHKLLSTDTQVLRLHKALASGSLTNINLSFI